MHCFFGCVRIQFRRTHLKFADVAELADALDSGSSESNFIWVQVPSSAPSKAIGFSVAFSFLAAELAGLAAARSRSGSDSPPDCHSLPSRRFATRWIQVPVTSRSYRFKSCYPHQTVQIRTQYQSVKGSDLSFFMALYQ